MALIISMNKLIHFAELPPEAGITLVFAAAIALIIGLKKKPKMTVSLILLAAGVWLYSEHGHVIHEQFHSLSQAQMK